MLARIKQYIDFKGISIAAFERSIGMSNASFGKSLKNGGSIGCDKIEKILNVYPDLNLEWLITGKGEMLNDISTSNSKAPPTNTECKLCQDKDRLIEALYTTISAQQKLIDNLENTANQDGEKRKAG